MNEVTNLMVSVDMITYGHENYIRQAIEGVLMQETDFEFDLIIADDCSPDDTSKIVEDIIKNHIKGYRIKYFRHKENMGMKANGMFAFEQCYGKYIAICEGDDYWTDPFKLQKQVDFLEANPEFSLCTGGYSEYNSNTYESQEYVLDNFGIFNGLGFVFTLEDMKKNWVTKTLTCLFLKSEVENVDFLKYNLFRDVHLFYHLLKEKKGFYFKSNFGIYNVHSGGVWSTKDFQYKYNTSYLVYKEIYKFEKNDFARYMSFITTNSLLRFIMSSKYEANNLTLRLILIKELFFLMRIKKSEEVRTFLGVFIPDFVKSKLRMIFRDANS